MFRSIQEKDIPRHMGGADYVRTDKIDNRPLVTEWAQRNQAEIVKAQERLPDLVDKFGYYGMTFDEVLDLEDERQKRLVWHTYWSVPRSSPQFSQAEKELYLIFNFYVAAMEWRQDWYDQRKQRLLDIGYSLAAVEGVPRPPDPIAVLHGENGCKGEIHQGLFKGKSGFSVGFRQNVDYKRYYCPQCGWIDGNHPELGATPEKGVSVGATYYNPLTLMSELLQDLGVPTIPPNPDYVCTLYYPDIDLEPGDDASEVSKADAAGRALTRRIMKAHGLLISVSEAAELLGTSTQNVSGYIAKRRLRSWQDPDDSRRQIVLRSEVEVMVGEIQQKRG